MKTFYPVICTAAIALLFLAPAPHAANSSSAATHSSTNAPGKQVLNTNYIAPEIAIPESVFDVTVKPTKDPFFPNSLRQPVPQVVTNTTLAFSASSFSLKGLSGSAGHPLALVNNRTVAPGEDAEITTATGRVKIHCVEIKATSVVLRVPTQLDPIEVYLRKAVQ